MDIVWWTVPIGVLAGIWVRYDVWERLVNARAGWKTLRRCGYSRRDIWRAWRRNRR